MDSVVQYGSCDGIGDKKAHLQNVYLAFSFIAMGGLLFGYVIGINSNVLQPGQLLCPTDGTGTVGSWTSLGYMQCYDLDDLQIGLLSSLNLFGACLSSLFCFRYSDVMGRKFEVQLAAVLYFFGAVLAGAGEALWMIYIGFTVYGLGIGFAMHAGPIYISEISPADVRGTLISAKELLIVLGIFLGFFSGFMYSGIDTVGWRAMVLVSGIVASIMAIGMHFIPESPRFLILTAVRSNSGGTTELIDQARKAMSFFTPGASLEEVDHEVDQLVCDAEGSLATESVKWTDSFKYPRALTVGCGLVFLQQITGQPSVLYFATTIFISAGFGDTAALSSVGIGLVKLLATFFSVWFVDDYGRRFLLFLGIGMMAAALACIGTAFLFIECLQTGLSVAACPQDNLRLPEGWAYLTVFGLMLYVSGYQVGFGPINWLIVSEIFPLRVRGAAMSIAAIVNFASNLLMTFSTPALQTALTLPGVFFFYLFFAIISILFVDRMVPETKGKTLEEIEQLMSGKRDDTITLETARGL